MKYRRFFPLLASSTVGLALVAGCGKAQKHARGPQAVPVQTAQAQKLDVPITSIAIGSVQALRTVAVKSQVDGVIAKINFAEGDEVNAGDLLVTIDPRPFENMLRSAEATLANVKAQLAQAEADAQRYQNLDQQAVVSKEELLQYQTKAESARAAVQSQEAIVQNAKLQLSYTEIRAPISGRTGQLSLHEGALIKANDASQSIVTINQLAPISVAYSVPEATLADIREAISRGSVRVQFVPHSGTLNPSPVEGKLQFIDNTVDPTTGTIVLKALVENKDRRLWPGEFVDVTTYIGEQKGAVVVPSAAVQVGQSGSQVFVVKPDQTVELREVKTGRPFGTRTVVSGVNAGDVVVTDGQLRLSPGAKVEIKPLSDSNSEVAKAGDGAQSTSPVEPKS
ncbi:MAG TPA: efflux RND transporter periplasmic adaptor subunit [Opitutaceae bacterium]|nr:efflux RND transporter periplasmic adaptor subunit [Opitutaceae bacterium]